MSKKRFTRDEVAFLKSNSIVKSSTEKVVSFTPEFCKEFYTRRLQGEQAAEIFRTHGIAPELLGERRIEGFDYQVRKKTERETGFLDGRKLNYRRPKAEAKTEADRITQLEHELAYTRQEVEFLKKLQMADMEARIAWESKHRQR